ncbi:SRPBCC family protein [Synoicihabitans lomoniglobus]|uniref:SRPBCC family protein n=1 Tax=Synoicihabitans lomoniglobus TaxID=2909285 RepID=A0AAF0CIK0_9BACT|nr:SRPBCC family protein [Opitutaceae bacterium LMO-M01]WED65492.1 SRPBCC family protein [Opitutaceae bacterium LMO-M01]
MKPNDQPGKFTTPAEVRLVRTLPGPIERIWDYLTDPAKRALWFAGGPMEPCEGGKMLLKFQHKNIAPEETPPEAYQEVHETGFEMPGTILRWEPPRVLTYTFDEDSDVTFELTAQGQYVVLVLTHRARGGDVPSIPGYAAGWHSHFAILIAQLAGETVPPFWATHAKLKAEYAKVYADLTT